MATETLTRSMRAVPGNGANVGDTERLVSALAGGVLAAYGMRRRSSEGLVFTLLGSSLLYRAATGHCSVYRAMGVSSCPADACNGGAIRAHHGVRVQKTITIDRPASELFRFWRKFENLPRVMAHLESVCQTGSGRSHWIAKAPLGFHVSWDAEIVNEKENELIAWRSIQGSQVATAGSVHFKPAPGKRGTEVSVNLKYDPPLGKIGTALARAFGSDPAIQIEEDMFCFKQLMEAGEIASTKGQPTGCR